MIVELFPAEDVQFARDAARPQVMTVVLDGELRERELSVLSDELLRLAHRGHVRLVVDFNDVPHVDYRGVKALSGAAHALRRMGGDLKLAGLSTYLQVIFRAGGAHDAFELYERTERARESFARKLAS